LKVEVFMSSRVSRRAALTLAVLGAAVASLVGASIGSSSSAVKIPANPLKATLAQVKGLKPAAREDKLYQLAKAQGGQLNVYTSLSALVVTGVTKAWADEYPDVKLNLYRGSSEDVTARVLSEASAGNSNGADVIETNGTTMLIFQHKQNLLVPYQQSPFASVIPKKYRFDTFTAARLEEFVVAWNTNLVKDPPTKIQDLADPKWKGKLSVEPTDSDWFATWFIYLTQQAKPKLTVAQADTLFKAIAANSQLVNGHTNQSTLLAAGQYSIVVSGHAQSLEQLQAKKAPVAFGPPFMTPVIERPQGMGISYGSSHPAAALLFYDWMLRGNTSDGKLAGQRILQANGVVPANPYYPDNAFSSKPAKVEMDIRPIVSHWAEWNDHYNRITATAPH
jgi:iron(III) transport system substrate-binding protein